MQEHTHTDGRTDRRFHRDIIPAYCTRLMRLNMYAISTLDHAVSSKPWVSSQAHWKAFRQRKNFNERKQHLKDHSDEAVKVTAHTIRLSIAMNINRRYSRRD